MNDVVQTEVAGLTSVLVAVYNVAPYLDECIASIVNQDECNLEIIVIDDASTDGSGDIADAWAHKDPRITVIRKPVNAGLYDTRNLSVRIAKGEYIAFVDGDDYIKPNMVSAMREQLEKTEADVALCGWVDLMPDGSNDRLVAAETGTVLDTESTLSYCFPEMGDTSYSPYVWNKLFRRRAILDASGRPIAFDSKRIASEDTTWLIRVLMGISSAVLIQDALYVYRSQRTGNKTTSAAVSPDLAISAVDSFSEGWELLASAGFPCARNMLQRALVHRQRGMYAAIAGRDESVWRACTTHYLRDVGIWFASSPSPRHLAWCLKRVVRRMQLEINHSISQQFV